MDESSSTIWNARSAIVTAAATVAGVIIAAAVALNQFGIIPGKHDKSASSAVVAPSQPSATAARATPSVPTHSRTPVQSSSSSHVRSAGAAYCVVHEPDKLNIYYRTQPGTTVSNGDEAWVVSAPSTTGNSEDDQGQLQDWWTPEFQWWEQFNKAAGFTPTGSGVIYSKYQYVLVLSNGNDPNSWERPQMFFAAHPGTDPKAEATQRRFFITVGIPNLGAPTCAGQR
jgi:hypothetical protein